MKKFTRILSIVLCAFMVLTLCACGSETQSGTMVGFDDETASIAGSGESGKPDEHASVAVSGNTSSATGESKVIMTGSDPFAKIPKHLRGTKVVFAHYGDEGASEYQKLGKSFEKKTGIKVEWKTFNQGEYVAQVAKQINGGAAPDIIICTDTFPSFLEIAQPLQNIVDLTDDFWDDNLVKIGTVGGNSYMVNSLNSVWNSIYMVFYNKELYKSHRIKTPGDYYKSGEWSYENLKKCLVDVTKIGKTGGWIDSHAMNIALGTSVIQYDADKKTFYSNNDKTVDAIQFVAQAYKEGLWTNAFWETFNNGSTGVNVGSAWGTKYNGWFENADDNMVAAVPLPTTYKGKTLKTAANVRGYGIAKGAKNPQGAAYFLRYYLDYEYYDDAGANVFKNKSLEKVYFDDVIPQAKKNGINYDFTNLFSIYSDSYSSWQKETERKDPAQIPGIVKSQNNVTDNVVKKANEKLNQYK